MKELIIIILTFYLTLSKSFALASNCDVESGQFCSRVFSDDEKEGLQIAERRILSVMSTTNSTGTREEQEEENPIDRLRKLPKVVDDKCVWETLSEADKSSLFFGK